MVLEKNHHSDCFQLHQPCRNRSNLSYSCLWVTFGDSQIFMLNSLNWSEKSASWSSDFYWLWNFYIMYCSFCSFIQSHRESSTTIVFIILYNISRNAFCRIFQDLYVFGCKKYLINRRSRGAAIILDFALMVSFAVFASGTANWNYGVTVTASKG